MANVERMLKEDNVDYLTKAFPLHVAVEQGQEMMVQFLIASQADVNAVNGEGYTPLELAQFEENSGLEEMLREAGAESTTDN